jgi:hypothetical protein
VAELPTYEQSLAAFNVVYRHCDYTTEAVKLVMDADLQAAIETLRKLPPALLSRWADPNCG